MNILQVVCFTLEVILYSNITNYFILGQKVKGFTQRDEVVKEGIKSVSSVPNYVSQSIKNKGEIFRSLIGNY